MQLAKQDTWVRDAMNFLRQRGVIAPAAGQAEQTRQPTEQTSQEQQSAWQKPLPLAAENIRRLIAQELEPLKIQLEETLKGKAPAGAVEHLINRVAARLWALPRRQEFANYAIAQEEAIRLLANPPQPLTEINTLLQQKGFTQLATQLAEQWKNLVENWQRRPPAGQSIKKALKERFENYLIERTLEILLKQRPNPLVEEITNAVMRALSKELARGSEQITQELLQNVIEEQRNILRSEIESRVRRFEYGIRDSNARALFRSEAEQLKTTKLQEFENVVAETLKNLGIKVTFPRAQQVGRVSKPGLMNFLVGIARRIHAAVGDIGAGQLEQRFKETEPAAQKLRERVRQVVAMELARRGLSNAKQISEDEADEIIRIAGNAVIRELGSPQNIAQNVRNTVTQVLQDARRYTLQDVEQQLSNIAKQYQTPSPTTIFKRRAKGAGFPDPWAARRKRTTTQTGFKIDLPEAVITILRWWQRLTPEEQEKLYRRLYAYLIAVDKEEKQQALKELKETAQKMGIPVK